MKRFERYCESGSVKLSTADSQRITAGERRTMKSKTARKAASKTERAVEYDFSKGVTGKYAARYWESAAQGTTKRARRKPA